MWAECAKQKFKLTFISQMTNQKNMIQPQWIFEFKKYNGIFAVHEYGFHGLYFYDFNQ